MRRILRNGRTQLAGLLTMALLAVSIPFSLIGSAQAEVFPSELTIRWNEERTLFKGRLTSDNPECIALRLVRVFKVRRGEKDKVVGVDLTNANGRWRVDKKRANGRYYARARASDIGGYYGAGDTCGKARSGTIEV
jgi:hypothetical protein